MNICEYSLNLESDCFEDGRHLSCDAGAAPDALLKTSFGVSRALAPAAAAAAFRRQLLESGIVTLVRFVGARVVGVSGWPAMSTGAAQLV